MMVDELGDHGFDVLEARNAEEAMALLQQHGATAHALFTDIQMPGTLNGLDLAHHTKEHWPHIALILASGHKNPTGEELPHGSRFFLKPYDVEKVVEHIKSVTGHTPAASPGN
jgi:YesN/AraC family two-component response regulator